MDYFGSILGKCREFFLRHSVQIGSKAYPASFSMGIDEYFPGDKATGV
jgi:hypothetical protein